MKGYIGIPKDLWILHLRFAVAIVDRDTALDAASAYGWTSKSKLAITICDELPPGLAADTLMHEAIHAMVFAYGLDFPLSEEILAKWIPGAMAKLFHDNPEFLTWWSDNAV